MEPSFLYGSESWPASGKEISRMLPKWNVSDGLQGKQDETASEMKEQEKTWDNKG
jgi:hypothetical protein